MDGTIGSIMLWPMNWAPRGWAFCWGQLISISDNPALFSLLGTNYGGDGRTNFALPDLRGRVPVGSGTGIGQPNYKLGAKGGIVEQNIQMDINHLPQHSHQLQNAQVTIPEQSVDIKLEATENTGQHSKPVTGDRLGAPQTSGRDVDLYTSASDQLVELSSQTVKIPASSAGLTGEVGMSGKGQAIHLDNRQPYLTLNYIICTVGTFPQRND